MESGRAKGNTHILKRGIGMKGISVKIRNMGLVSTITKGLVNTSDISRITKDMVKVCLLTKLVISMSVGSSMAKNMAKESMNSTKLPSNYKASGIMAI